MGRLTCILIAAVILTSCDKRKETAVRMSGLWKIESTIISFYANNQVVKDSTVEQQGELSLITSDGLENRASTNLPYAPCWSNCSWEIPKKKKNQIFFSYYTESPPSIQATSVMVEKYSNKKLVLIKANYDGELNILQKSRWEFSKVKL